MYDQLRQFFGNKGKAEDDGGRRVPCIPCRRVTPQTLLTAGLVLRGTDCSGLRGVSILG